MKFGFDVPSGVREDVENNGHIHVSSLETGADNSLGYFLFSPTQLFSQFSPLLQVFLSINDFVTVFPIFEGVHHIN